jgi:hypothetical protein
MTTGKFVISLDFELFWGVCDTQTLASYGRNIMGARAAIPRLLALFRQHGLRATWATVGMIMCRNYDHWHNVRPKVLPAYARAGISPYSMESFIKKHVELFFARPLVEHIMATDGQELATHTYSHFYCNETGATPQQFAADLACARGLAADMGTQLRSIVLPRNQIIQKFLSVLPEAGIKVYRGNSAHWLYRNGNTVPGGIAGRMVRFADACFPLSGKRSVCAQRNGALVNVPASAFLYAWSSRHRRLSAMRLDRLKQDMTEAAKTGKVFHLWWHPHNFGRELDGNLVLLEAVLQHFHLLSDRYGMENRCMADFALLK